VTRRPVLSVADVVTLGNAALGATALSLIAGDLWLHPNSAPGTTVVESACLLVVLAGVLDGLDGLVARRLGASIVGARLDVACDLLTFGAVPALLLAALDGPESPLWSGLAIALAGTYLLAAVFRLARHTRSRDVGRRCFRGLPMPSAAAASIAVVLVARPGAEQLGLVAGVCLLMVSELPYPRPTRGAATLIAVAVAVLAAAVAGAIPVRIIAIAWLAAVPLIPLFPAVFGLPRRALGSRRETHLSIRSPR
jgi:CDP-diacylglycerol--serine O-phosphatidyltransferase